MTNKHRMLTSYVIKEMQIGTMRCHHIFTTMTNSSTLMIANAGNHVEKEILSFCYRKCKIIQPATLEVILAICHKTKKKKRNLTIRSSTVILSVYSQESKSCVYTQSFTRMFTVAFFTITNTKQPNMCFHR